VSADSRLRPLQSGVHPDNLSPEYRSTPSRAPRQSPVMLAASDAECSVVDVAAALIAPLDADLTRQSTAAPLGERIIVSGRVLDEDGRPVRRSLVEIWQCNAAGRYAHRGDQHDAPLDPHFVGRGKVLTGDDGEYRFVTIKPGAYPWRNHHNAWRPAHIHFSLFGNAYAQRLITQMYFPGDPLLALDPIYNSVPERARTRLVSQFDLGLTVPETALGYRFDIVLRGRHATPMGL
jgi:protocatechuate 3,4-dioxygenase beta subunit